MTSISEYISLKIPYGYIVDFEFKNNKLICILPCIEGKSKVIGNITVMYKYNPETNIMEVNKFTVDKSLKKEIM